MTIGTFPKVRSAKQKQVALIAIRVLSLMQAIVTKREWKSDKASKVTVRNIEEKQRILEGRSQTAAIFNR